MTLIDIARPAPDVAILTLDRPERLNALSFALVEELHDAWPRSSETTRAAS